MSKIALNVPNGEAVNAQNSPEYPQWETVNVQNSPECLQEGGSVKQAKCNFREGQNVFKLQTLHFDAPVQKFIAGGNLIKIF